MASTITCIAGNDASWTITISMDELFYATDLVFLAKKRISDADADAVITAIPAVLHGGTVKVDLAPEATEAVEPGRWYVFGIQWRGSDGVLSEWPPANEPPGALYVRRGLVADIPAPPDPPPS